jgi:translation initiation factor 3 subunit C
MAQRQQNVAELLPPFFIRQITTMETSVTDALASEKGKAGGKKMNATNAKALTAMRQKVKKTLKEYEKEAKRFTEVPNTPVHITLASTHVSL